MIIIPKIKKAKELSRNETAFLVSFVRRNYGLKLKINTERLFLSRRFQRGVLNAKLQVSRDETVGASLFFAKMIAKRERLGIYRSRA